MRRSFRLLQIGAASAWLAGCAAWGPTEPLFRGTLEESLVERTATVEEIDPNAGSISLRHGARRLVFPADHRVQELERLRPGDEVVVAYYEAIVFDIEPANERRGPAASREDLVARRGTVVEVDREMPSLQLRGSSGAVQTLKVREPSTLDDVGIGDEVAVSYTPARAVSIRKTAPL